MDDISLYFDGQIAMINRILLKQKVNPKLRDFLEKEKVGCEEAKKLILELMGRKKNKQPLKES